VSAGVEARSAALVPWTTRRVATSMTMRSAPKGTQMTTARRTRKTTTTTPTTTTMMFWTEAGGYGPALGVGIGLLVRASRGGDCCVVLRWSRLHVVAPLVASLCTA